MLPKSNKLMNRAHATDNRKIVDDHVSSQIHCIRKDHVVADDAVMRHVGVGHHQNIVPNLGGIAFFRSPVNRCKFADRAIFPDFTSGDFSGKLQILRNARNDGSRENACVFADAGTIVNHDIAAQSTSLFDYDISLDRHERFYLYTLCNFGVGVDMCHRILQLFKRIKNGE